MTRPLLRHYKELKMSFKQGSIIDENLVQKIRETKYESNKKERDYYRRELDNFDEKYGNEELIKLKNEFEEIDLDDPAVYYDYGERANKPVYKYLEDLSPYYERKKNLIEKIAKIDKKIAEGHKGKTYDELLKESLQEYSIEVRDVIYNDFYKRDDKDIKNVKKVNYQLELDIYHSISLNIPQDFNSLRDAMVSFQFGDFYTFIDVSGEWEATINYVDKNKLEHPIYHSGKHIFY